VDNNDGLEILRSPRCNANAAAFAAATDVPVACVVEPPRRDGDDEDDDDDDDAL
jgi:hypothetical protein